MTPKPHAGEADPVSTPTCWIPWAPTVEPTREECEALIGRKIRMVFGRSCWMVLVVEAVRAEDGRIVAFTARNEIRLWEEDAAPVGVEIEAPLLTLPAVIANIRPGDVVLVVSAPDGSYVTLPVPRGKTVVLAMEDTPNSLPFKVELPLAEFDRICLAAGVQPVMPAGGVH